jgi:hypothetical protein
MHGELILRQRASGQGTRAHSDSGECGRGFFLPSMGMSPDDEIMKKTYLDFFKKNVKLDGRLVDMMGK